MKYKLLPVMIILSSALSAQVVDNPLGREVQQVFPELRSGYIDLNQNNRMDRLDDMDEKVPESIIKDNQLQVQEILDFAILNYRFIPVTKLEALKETLSTSSGTISEIIALNYSFKLQRLIEEKIESGGDSLYLTPSARAAAMKQIHEYITQMTLSYQKEGGSSEAAFIEARDNLFDMIETGYPLPSDMNDDDITLLISALVHTINTEASSNPARVRSAIRTLGKLEAEFALPYLIPLIDSDQFSGEAIRTLGLIGDTAILPQLTDKLEESQNIEIRNILIQAIGRIGGDQSLDILFDLLENNQDSGAGNPAAGETRKAVLEALSRIAEKGTRDRRVPETLNSYLSSEEPELRLIAIKGISHFSNQAYSTTLLTMLRSEDDDVIRSQIIESSRNFNNPSTINTFILLLRETDLSEELTISLLNNAGVHEEGVKAATQICSYLKSPSTAIRDAAYKALLNLYPVNPSNIVGTVSRLLLTDESVDFRTAGTKFLADVADPASINTCATLLESSREPEVRKNVTWTIYRIGSTTNSKIQPELKKIVLSETENLEVRINAARALGAIGTDSPQLKIAQTLLTTAKMRGPQYGNLRRYAIRAFGQLTPLEESSITELSSILRKESDIILQREAVRAIQSAALLPSESVDDLLATFRRSGDQELKILILETLGDFGITDSVTLADEYLAEVDDSSDRGRILYALARIDSDAAYKAVLRNIPTDKDVIVNILEGSSSRILAETVEKMVVSESNEATVDILLFLLDSFASAF